tara:strand:+ start:525 stop:659 length:135 start_codon:yes stop_codon:yes gene_type:complete
MTQALNQIPLQQTKTAVIALEQRFKEKQFFGGAMTLIPLSGIKS